MSPWNATSLRLDARLQCMMFSQTLTTNTINLKYMLLYIRICDSLHVSYQLAMNIAGKDLTESLKMLYTITGFINGPPVVMKTVQL